MQMDLQNRCYSFPKKQLIPNNANLTVCVHLQSFSEAVRKFLSCKPHGVSPVLCHGDCNIYYAHAVLGRNLAQENTSRETPVMIASFSPKFGKTLTALHEWSRHFLD